MLNKVCQIVDIKGMKFLARLLRSTSGSQTIDSVPLISIFSIACVAIISYAGWDVIMACWRVIWDTI
jgi:hypothetical protein